MKKLLHRRFFGPIPALVLSLVVTFVVSVGAPGVQAQLAAGVVDRGTIPAAMPVRATIVLRPEAARTEALVRFLSDVQTAGSGSYRQFVSTRDFAGRYGVSPAQIERVRAFAESAGLTVESVSGLRVQVSGTAGQMELAFAPGLHQIIAGATKYVASTSAGVVPDAVAADVLRVGGMSTLPENHAITVAADGVAMAPGGYGSLEDLATAVESNAAGVLALRGAACVSDFSSNEREAMQSLLREAAAQGITVLAQSGCGGGASFPAVLPEVTAVVAAPVTEAGVGGQARPEWQVAVGLPQDLLRHEPDAMVSSIDALAATMLQIAARSAGRRVGQANAVLYALAPIKGLYSQADAATTGLTGNWESATGLGTIDLEKLLKAYPQGSQAVYIQVNTLPLYATHGQAVTFTAAIKDTSGAGTTSPTGTVVFTTDTGASLGSATLVSTGTTTASASVTYSQLPAGSENVIASYSGDSFYQAAKNQTYFTVGAEEGVLSASIAGAVTLGGTLVVTIKDTSGSGVGTPNVSGYVIPQGVTGSQTYTVALTGSNGVASGTVMIPATQAGAITLFVGCTSTDPNFTCYNSFDTTATVNKATPTLALLVQPSPIVAGLPVLFTATVTGTKGQTAPTGVVIFFDNGVNIGQNGVDATGKSTFTAQGLSATASHFFTATYYGDGNYLGASSNAATATGANASSTLLTVTPNPPVSGATTTLQANVVSNVSTVSAAATGTVTFYQDGVALAPVATLNGSGVGVYMSTVLSGTTAHAYTAVYSGDVTYQTSTSNTVSTTATSTAASVTMLTVTPNPPVSGTATTLQATVTSGTTGTTATATGTVVFYQDGVALTQAIALNASGVGTYAAAGLTGAHSYTAVYSGSTTYQTSTSNAVSTAAGTSTTTTAVTVTPNPPVSGATTTLTAKIAYTPVGSATPTGTVTFSQDGVALTPSSTVTAGAAAFTSSTLSGTKAHVYTASYSGDSVYAGSVAPTIQTPAASAGTAASVTTLSSSANTVVTGGTVTFTVSVASGAATSTTVPTGIVTLTNAAGTVLGSAALSATGGATIPYTSATAGTQVITATYSGDATYAISSSKSVTLVTGATAATATLTLALSPTQVTYGAGTTASATINGVTTDGLAPTGTVTFTVSNTTTGALVGSFAVALSSVSTTSSTASSQVFGGTPGTYTVTATCVTTNISCAGLSQALGFVVGKGASTIVVTASPNPPVVGQPEVLSATITPTYGGTATFTGYVTFYINGVAVGTSQVSGNTATFTTTLPSTTSNVIYAVYSGDGNWLGSTSATTSLAIPPTMTSSTLSASTNSALAGSNVTLSMTVTALPNSVYTTQLNPAGYVSFYDTFNGVQTMLGSVALTASGQFTSIAQLNTTGLIAGTHTILAVYTGATQFTTSTAATVTVNITDYTVQFSPSNATVAKGQTVTALITVAAVNGFAGEVVLGCVAPANTATTCSISPNIVDISGITTLTITTTKATSGALRQPGLPGTIEDVSVALLLMALLLPGFRRKRPVLMVALTTVFLMGAVGCTTVRSETGVTSGGGGTGTSSGGTPSGTQLFAITASGTDGRTTNRHNYQFQVTVQ